MNITIHQLFQRVPAVLSSSGPLEGVHKPLVVHQRPPVTTGESRETNWGPGLGPKVETLMDKDRSSARGSWAVKRCENPKSSIWIHLGVSINGSIP